MRWPGRLRAWAQTNFHEYALLYGSPVPGYAAPDETIAPAQRVPARLLGLMAEVEAAGLPCWGLPTRGSLEPSGRRSAPIREAYGGVGDERMMRALTAWATLLGQLTLELFGPSARVLDLTRVRRPRLRRVTHMMERVADDLGLT